ncbi:hypothetical protein RN001_009287 [Aquatica leii]|uniref:Uncharacterized protein n=1 Tax=Aquatica leii TaxID=1421715 RepID=A0AAN7S836_9COLE|nr:hypothetical protein RN001_009287 [Aquatica leii]
MKIIIILVFVTLVHSYPPGQILYSDNLSNSVDEVYDTYLSVADDDKEDINPPPPEPYLNKLIEETINLENLIHPEDAQRVERTAFVHVQTQEKNKRYSSYLTLCHFKICNMGRKRTTRYFQMMRSLDNKT